MLEKKNDSECGRVVLFRRKAGRSVLPFSRAGILPVFGDWTIFMTVGLESLPAGGAAPKATKARPTSEASFKGGNKQHSALSVARGGFVFRG